MTLELMVADLANGGAPFEGVAVYVWHCSREGGYSLYSAGIEDQNYLRGVQVADADGLVRFTSVFPACYDGRWPHVHVEVYPDQGSTTDAANAIATSQVALPQDACEAVYATTGYEASVDNLSRVSLTGDNVFGDDGGASQLGTVTGDVTSGYAVRLAVGAVPAQAAARRPVELTRRPDGLAHSSCMRRGEPAVGESGSWLSAGDPAHHGQPWRRS
ncbi:dioxygenase family protein [Geodermatophilus sp. SYSU D01176]